MKYLSHLLLIMSGCIWLATSAYADNSMRFDVKGLQGEVLNNVNSRLAIEEAAYANRMTTENIQAIYQQAPHEIQKALQPFGYFRSEIQSTLTHQGSAWIAHFTVHAGPIIKIKQVEFTITGMGKDNPVLQQAILQLPLKVGQDFNSEVYTKSKENLLQIANNQGYVKSFFTVSEIQIDLKAYQVVIRMHFDTKQRYYVGRITFSESPFATTFLQRFIHFKENEPFSSQKLIDLQQKMASSFFFSRVVITPDFKNVTHDRVPVLISLAPQKSQKYNIGVGYGTFTGPRLTAGVSFRRLTDTGQHLDAQLKLSSVLSGLSMKYYIPGRNPYADRWIIGTNYQKFSPKNGTSISRSMSVGFSKKWHKIRTSTNLNYLIDKYSVNRNPTLIKNLLYPSFNINYVNTDNLIKPTWGKSLDVTLQGASRRIFSSTDFLQADIKGKYVFTPASFARVIVRGELGYTLVNDINDLPLTMRFFAGGINSIRGYADSSIGPGKYLGVGSLEYQNHIRGPWSGAVFYDFGYASNQWNAPLKKSTGVGIVYQSMVGPIKLYATHPLNKGNKSLGVEFSIGPEF